MAIMTSSGAVLQKAGDGVSADLTGAGNVGESADTIIGRFISGAQATINAVTRINYCDTYATLNEDVKYILEDVCTSLAAIHCISYDMSGYTSTTEAQSMIDIQRDNALRGMSLLKDKKQTTFINDA